MGSNKTPIWESRSHPEEAPSSPLVKWGITSAMVTNTPLLVEDGSTAIFISLKTKFTKNEIHKKVESWRRNGGGGEKTYRALEDVDAILSPPAGAFSARESSIRIGAGSSQPGAREVTMTAIDEPSCSGQRTAPGRARETRQTRQTTPPTHCRPLLSLPHFYGARVRVDISQNMKETNVNVLLFVSLSLPPCLARSASLCSIIPLAWSSGVEYRIGTEWDCATPHLARVVILWIKLINCLAC